ncbi:MAG: hypothetical protein Q4F05_12430 [bacterium]|nr:hypothetical protein [bacterium]
MRKKIFAIFLCTSFLVGCSSTDVIKLENTSSQSQSMQELTNKVTCKVIGTYDETKVNATVKKLEDRAKVYSATAKITANKEDSTITIELPDIKTNEKVQSIVQDITGVGDITFDDENHNTLLTSDFIAEATSTSLSNSSDTASVLDANYAITLKFNEKGAKKFATITQDNIGKQICLSCDKTTILKATVQSVIVDGNIVLDGFASKEEVDSIVTKLKSGTLDVKLEIA